MDETGRAKHWVRTAKTVAVVGMKDDRSPGAPAFYVPDSMHHAGIRLIPVNPTLAGVSVFGEPARATLADVGEAVDIVQVFRRSDAVGEVADQVLALPPALRPKCVWMQSGIVNEDAAARLRAAGIEVIMDRCFKVDLARFGRAG